MSTVVKDLGAATAYGYAVEKGYTGTEAEFAELMADYAEVGQRAENAADSALESKTAAQTAATTATNKASEATTAATTATTKAGEASTSASTATSAKDTAVSASQTATSKASEATTAAATATSAATTATTAKDDAVSAKTAAQTAQTGAETAAASVSASAAQIATNAEDINQLKSEITKISESSVNLMPETAKTLTSNGVQTVYNDGQFTVTGTATASGDGDAHRSDTFTLPTGTYTLTRSVAYGQIAIRKNATTRVALLQGNAYSTTFTLSEDTDVYLTFGLENGLSYNFTTTLQVESGSIATDFTAPSYMTANDKVARSDIALIGVPYESITPVWTAGKSFIYNAGWTNNSGWSYADVDLMQGQSLDIILHVYPTVFPLSVWSEDGNSILKACVSRPTAEGEEHYIYTCSAQHEKVRINVLNTYRNAVIAKVYKPNNLVNVSNVLAEKHSNDCYDVLHENVIAIGDSLTQGSYTGSDLHTEYSYPAFMQKKMQNSVENAGRAGWSTSQWWKGNATEQKGFPYYDYSDYDTAVIFLGTNGGLTDTLAQDVDPYSDYTQYASTNTGNYCKIIEGMKAQNADINIFLCTIWAGGGTDGMDGTNAVIRQIAEKYNLPVIDLFSEFNTSYSAYHAISGNIHLGIIGYARMADVIRQSINDDVMVNPTKYNYIPN